MRCSDLASNHQQSMRWRLSSEVTTFRLKGGIIL